jgi:hypothetical protein
MMALEMLVLLWWVTKALYYRLQEYCVRPPTLGSAAVASLSNSSTKTAFFERAVLTLIVTVLSAALY